MSTGGGLSVALWKSNVTVGHADTKTLRLGTQRSPGLSRRAAGVSRLAGRSLGETGPRRAISPAPQIAYFDRPRLELAEFLGRRKIR